MTQATLLCILLYLAVIFSPGTYYQSEIDTFEAQHQADISAIHAQPTLETQIVHDFTPQLEFIDIFDTDAVD